MAHNMSPRKRAAIVWALQLKDFSAAQGRLDLTCGTCRRPWSRPVQDLKAEHDATMTFGSVLLAQRCPTCQGQPEEAFLTALDAEPPGVPVLGPKSY